MIRRQQPRVIIIGGGGHARSLLALQAFVPVGYVDRHVCHGLALPYLGTDDALDDAFADTALILGIGISSDGSTAARRRLADRYAGRRFATIVPSTATVCSPLGDGTAVFHRAVVNGGCTVGRHCVINTGAIVEHDCRLGDNVFIGPGAILCGAVSIGDGATIGAGAVINPGVAICSGAIVGSGAVVINDITQPGVYAGNPVRCIRQ